MGRLQAKPPPKRGRPPKNDKALRSVAARLPTDECAAFHGLAKRQGMTAAALLRLMIQDALVQDEYNAW